MNSAKACGFARLRTIAPVVVCAMMVFSTIARAQTMCPPLGPDGSPDPLTGVINTYWPGTQSATAGSTTIKVGAPRGPAGLLEPGGATGSGSAHCASARSA